MSDDEFFSSPILRGLANELGIGPTPRSQIQDPRMGGQNSLPPATVLAVTPPQTVKRVKVLEVNAPLDCVNRGMATVHISARDASTRIVTGTNQRLVGTVEWQTGNAGGSAPVDLTQGGVFSVAGAQVVRVYATLESNELDTESGQLVPLIPGQDKLLEGCVQWGSSTFQPAYYSTPLVTIGGGPSLLLPVPPQARRILAWSNTAGTTLTAMMRDASGTVPIYSADFQRTTAGANGTPIVNGAETLTLTSNVPCKAFAVFELWL